MLNVFIAVVFKNIVVKLFFFFLAPFNNQAFVANNLSFKFRNVYIRYNYLFIDEFFTVSEPPVKVNGSYKGFKKITVYVFAKVLCRYFTLNPFYKVKVTPQFI